MRQEMSVWCALSSGKCTNSSPLFSFLETMWSSSPNQEWSPPLQTTLFWICLQLFCSFNPHTDIFVLRPVCGVPWLSWDRMWTCQVWPAPRYLPPGLLWLGMCTLKSYRQWQRPSWQPTTSKACFFTTERQSSKWTAPPITDLLMYTNCSLKALLLALFFPIRPSLGTYPLNSSQQRIIPCSHRSYNPLLVTLKEGVIREYWCTSLLLHLESQLKDFTKI